MPQPFTTDHLELLRSFVETHCGWTAPDALHPRIEKRFMAMAKKAGCAGIDEFMLKIQSKPLEWRNKISQAMTLRRARFFDHPDAFTALRVEALPEIESRSTPRGAIRVWIPDCETGEEAYSLSITLLEYAESAEGGGDVPRLLATDPIPSRLYVAMSGRYETRLVAGDIDNEARERYFDEQNGNFICKPELRRPIRFQQENLMTDFSNITGQHVIFFRGGAEVYRAETLEDIHQRLVKALAPRGFLMLGTDEAVLGAAAERFEARSFRDVTFYQLKEREG